MGSNYEKATRHFIETEILVHFDHMLVDDPEGEDELQGGTVWRMILKDLKLLGFNMDEEDGWAMLGLCRYEGPEVDKATIGKKDVETCDHCLEILAAGSSTGSDCGAWKSLLPQCAGPCEPDHKS